MLWEIEVDGLTYEREGVSTDIVYKNIKTELGIDEMTPVTIRKANGRKESEKQFGQRKVMAGVEKIGTITDKTEDKVFIDKKEYAIGDLAKNFISKHAVGTKGVYTVKKIKDVETITFFRPSGQGQPAAPAPDPVQKPPKETTYVPPANPDEHAQTAPDAGSDAGMNEDTTDSENPQETQAMNAEQASGISGTVTITTHISTGPYSHFEMTVAESSGERARVLLAKEAEKHIAVQKRLQYLASLEYFPKKDDPVRF